MDVTIDEMSLFIRRNCIGMPVRDCDEYYSYSDVRKLLTKYTEELKAENEKLRAELEEELVDDTLFFKRFIKDTNGEEVYKDTEEYNNEIYTNDFVYWLENRLRDAEKLQDPTKVSVPRELSEIDKQELPRSIKNCWQDLMEYFTKEPS